MSSCLHHIVTSFLGLTSPRLTASRIMVASSLSCLHFHVFTRGAIQKDQDMVKHAVAPASFIVVRRAAGRAAGLYVYASIKKYMLP